MELRGVSSTWCASPSRNLGPTPPLRTVHPSHISRTRRSGLLFPWPFTICCSAARSLDPDHHLIPIYLPSPSAVAQLIFPFRRNICAFCPISHTSLLDSQVSQANVQTNNALPFHSYFFSFSSPIIISLCTSPTSVMAEISDSSDSSSLLSYKSAMEGTSDDHWESNSVSSSELEMAQEISDLDSCLVLPSRSKYIPQYHY